MKPYIIVVVVCAMALASCSGAKSTDPRKLQGQHITLPSDEAVWRMHDRDTAYVRQGGRPAILTYFDARGCVPCRMKELRLWRPIMNRIEADSLDVDMIFVFRTRSDNPDLSAILASSRIDVPVLCDPGGELERENTIPEEPLLQTFLLDRNDNIVLVGAPVYNPDLWALYAERIRQMQAPAGS